MGYRSMPHTADIRIEAWAPSRDECLAEAVRALVAGFADITASAPTGTVEVSIDPGTDEDLLVDLLNEVIYRLEIDGQVPLAAEVTGLPGGLRVRFAMTEVEQVEPIGAAPKAVSLHDLRLADEGTQWTCTATVDV